MGKPIERSFTQEKTILKYFPYEGASCLVPASMGTTQANGLVIVKGGTPFPSNDSSCLGYLLHDVDVTQGDAPATYVYQGTIDNAKLTEAGITVDSTAKAVTPRVTFAD